MVPDAEISRTQVINILVKEKVRKVTKPTKSSQRKIVESKKRRGEIKRNRQRFLDHSIK